MAIPVQFAWATISKSQSLLYLLFEFSILLKVNKIQFNVVPNSRVNKSNGLVFCFVQIVFGATSMKISHVGWIIHGWSTASRALVCINRCTAHETKQFYQLLSTVSIKSSDAY